MVDFDNVNRIVNQTFGEIAQTGRTPMYTPKGGTAFPLDGVFDRAQKDVTFTGRHGGIPVSTVKPALGCRLADFPVDVIPKQGDSWTRYEPLLNEDGSQQSDESGNPLWREKMFTVSDVRPDGITGSGWVQLIFN